MYAQQFKRASKLHIAQTTLDFRLPVIKMWKHVVLVPSNIGNYILKKIFLYNFTKSRCNYYRFCCFFSLRKENNDTEYPQLFESVYINKPNLPHKTARTPLESNYTNRLESIFLRQATCVVNRHESRLFVRQVVTLSVRCDLVSEVCFNKR